MLLINKMFKNKRGDDMLIDFWAIAVFAVIILLFFLLFSLSKSQNDSSVQAKFINKDVNFMLESFLRAPALEVGDSSKTIGEVITEDSTTGDFTRTEKLFETYFNQVNTLNGFKVNAIRIDITGPNSDGDTITRNQKTWRFIRAKFLSFTDGRKDVYVSETYLPGYESRIDVKLSLTELILASELKDAANKEKAQQNTK